ncbi:MAG: AAA family ATPase [Legionella sp.]|nr:AAA family ATPase [Legionella sp.]
MLLSISSDDEFYRFISSEKLNALFKSFELTYPKSSFSSLFAYTPPGTPNIDYATKGLPWFERTAIMDSEEEGKKSILILDPLLAHHYGVRTISDSDYLDRVTVIKALSFSGFKLYYPKWVGASYEIVELIKLSELKQLYPIFPSFDILLKECCEKFNLHRDELFPLDTFTSMQILNAIISGRTKKHAIMYSSIFSPANINFLRPVIDHFCNKARFGIQFEYLDETLTILSSVLNDIPPEKITHFQTPKSVTNPGKKLKPYEEIGKNSEAPCIDSHQTLDLQELSNRYPQLARLTIILHHDYEFHNDEKINFQRLDHLSLHLSQPFLTYQENEYHQKFFMQLDINPDIKSLKVINFPRFRSINTPFARDITGLKSIKIIYKQMINNFQHLVNLINQNKGLMDLTIFNEKNDESLLSLPSHISTVQPDRLESLTLKSIGIASNDLQNLLDNNQSLTTLFLHNCYLIDNWDDNWEGMLPKLKNLTIHYDDNSREKTHEEHKLNESPISAIVKNSFQLEYISLSEPTSVKPVKITSETEDHLMEAAEAAANTTLLGNLLRDAHHLKELILIGMALGSDEAHIPSLHLQSLTTLTIQSVKKPEKLLAEISQNSPNLRTVYVENLDMGDEVCDLIQFEKVKYLSLPDSKLHFEKLCNKLNKSTIEELNIRQALFIEAVQDLPLNQEIPSLKHLSCTFLRIKGQELAAILGTFPNLVQLDLAGTITTGRFYFKNPFHSLVELNIRGMCAHPTNLRHLILNCPLLALTFYDELNGEWEEDSDEDSEDSEDSDEDELDDISSVQLAEDRLKTTISDSESYGSRNYHYQTSSFQQHPIIRKTDSSTYTPQDTSLKAVEYLPGVAPTLYRLRQYSHINRANESFLYVPPDHHLVEVEKYDVARLKLLGPGEMAVPADGQYHPIVSSQPYDLVEITGANFRCHLKKDILTLQYSIRSIHPEEEDLLFQFKTYMLKEFAVLQHYYFNPPWHVVNELQLSVTKTIINWLCHNFDTPAIWDSAIKWLYGDANKCNYFDEKIRNEGANLGIMPGLIEQYRLLTGHQTPNNILIEEFQKVVINQLNFLDDVNAIPAIINWLLMPCPFSPYNAVPMILIATSWQSKHPLARHSMLKEFFSNNEFLNGFANENLDLLTEPNELFAILTQRRGACRHRCDGFLFLAPMLLPDFFVWQSANEVHNYIESMYKKHWVRLSDTLTWSPILKSDLGGPRVHLQLEKFPKKIPEQGLVKPVFLPEKMPPQGRPSLPPKAIVFAKWNFTKATPDTLITQIVAAPGPSVLVAIQDTPDVDFLYQALLKQNDDYATACPTTYLLSNLQEIESFSLRIKNGQKTRRDSAWEAMINSGQPVNFLVNATAKNIGQFSGMLNFLTDNKRRRLNDVALPPSVKIIIVINQLQRNNFSPDFYSRIDQSFQVYTSLNSLQLSQARTSTETPRTIPIELYESPQAINELIGKTALDATGQYIYAQGLLPRVRKTSKAQSELTTIVLKNEPSTSLATRAPFTMLFNARRYFTNGKWYTLPANVDLVSERAPYNFPGNYTVFRFENNIPSHHYEAILNQNTFALFFEIFKVLGETLTQHPGWLQGHQQRNLSLLVTAELQPSQWSKLLNHADRYQVDLAIFVPSHITIPGELGKKSVPLPPLPPAKIFALSQVKHRDTHHAVAQLKQRYPEAEIFLIPTSYNSTDLLLNLNYRPNVNDSALHFDVKPRVLYEAIKAEKTIILEGDLSNELLESLLSLLSSPAKLWLNGEWVIIPENSRIIWVHDCKKTLTKLIPSHDFNPEISVWDTLRNSREFAERDIQHLENFLTEEKEITQIPPYAMLLSLLGLMAKQAKFPLNSFLPWLRPDLSVSTINSLIKRLKQNWEQSTTFNQDITEISLGKRQGIDAIAGPQMPPPKRQKRLENKRKLPNALQKCLGKIASLWQHLPGVMLLGDAGTGKTYVVLEELIPYFKAQGITIDLSVSECAFEKWVKTPAVPNQYNVWFVDEANLKARGYWKYIEAFLQGKPVFIDGVSYKLGPEHKIIFAGNLNHYKGRHPMPEVEPYIGAIVFNPLTLEEIQSLILQPLVATLFQQKTQLAQLLTNAFTIDNFITLVLDNWQKNHALISSRRLSNYILRLWLQTEKLLQQELTNEDAESKLLKLLDNAQLSIEKPKISFTQKRPMAHTPATFFQTVIPQVPTANCEMINAEGEIPFIITPSRRAIHERIVAMLVLRQMRQTVQNIGHVGDRGLILEGSAGIGKTEIVLATLESQGFTLANIHDEKCRQVEHYYHITHSSLAETRQILLQAAEDGAVVVFDELNTCSEEYLAQIEILLNTLLSGKNLSGQSFKKEGFTLFITQNPAATYHNRRLLSDALLDRMEQTTVDDYPPEELTALGRLKYPMIPAERIDETSAAYEPAVAYSKEHCLHPEPCCRDFFKELDKLKAKYDISP